jgi:hypothetical protein
VRGVGGEGGGKGGGEGGGARLLPLDGSKDVNSSVVRKKYKLTS